MTSVVAEGIDHAWGSPPLGALDGKEFIAGYVSDRDLSDGISTKDLSRKEVLRLAPAGKKFVIVFETTAERAREGFNAGMADAQTALAEAAFSFKWPRNRPIYFAVDFPARGPEVHDYFKGAQRVMGAMTGVYGSATVVKYCHDQKLAFWFWQTYAWSNGVVHDEFIHILQYSNGHTLGGVSCDLDRAYRDDYGQWSPTQEDNMPTVQEIWTTPLIDDPDKGPGAPKLTPANCLRSARRDSSRALTHTNDILDQLAALVKLVGEPMSDADRKALADEVAKDIAQIKIKITSEVSVDDGSSS